MYLTFSNLNSIHWIIKKDIGLYVLFRTFQVNFQDISVTRLMLHKYHLLNQLQVFMRYKTLPK